MYSRSEYNKDVWVLTGKVVPLSWRFSMRLVSASARSEMFSLLLWDKSSIGQTILLVSPYDTSCIVSSFLMCPAGYVLLAMLWGEFSVDSTYSDFTLLLPKLADDMTSLSWSAGGMGDAIWPSVGHAQLEFLLPLPTDAGVAVSGLVVTVSVCIVWAVLTKSVKEVQSTPLL